MNSSRSRRIVHQSLARIAPRGAMITSTRMGRQQLAPKMNGIVLPFRSASTIPQTSGLLMSKFMQPVTATSQTSVEEFDSALWQYVSLAGDPIAVLSTATARDPTMVMGYVLSAALQLLSTGLTGNSANVQELRAKIREVVRTGKVTEREKVAAIAIELLATGHWRLAAAIIDNQLMRSPTDLLFVRLSHDIHFFLGETEQLLQSLNRVFQYWDPTMPGYGRVCGMLSFALCENGSFERAEELAMMALHLDNMDVWAAHGAVHVYEMMGRREEGLRLLRELEDNWTQANMFHKHMSWHKCLLQLEEGTNGYRASLSSFDDIFVHQIEHAPPALSDYSSLLLRLQLLHNPVSQIRGTFELDPSSTAADASTVGEDAAKANRSATHTTARWMLRPKTIDETCQGFIQGTEKTYPSGHILPDLPDFIRPPTGDPIPFPISRLSIRRCKESEGSTPCPFDSELPPHLKGLFQHPTRWEFLANSWAPYLRTVPEAPPGGGLRTNPRRSEHIHVYNDVHALMALVYAAKSGAPSPAGATWYASDLEKVEQETQRGLAGGDWRELSPSEQECGAPALFVHENPVTYMDHAHNLLMQMRNNALLSMYPHAFPQGTAEKSPNESATDLPELCASIDSTFDFAPSTVLSYVLSSSFPSFIQSTDANTTTNDPITTPPLSTPSPLLQLSFAPSHPFVQFRTPDSQIVNAAAGCDLAFGVYSFARQRYTDAARYLTRCLPQIRHMGGSKPQREIFNVLYLHALVGAVMELQENTQQAIDAVIKAQAEHSDATAKDLGESKETKVTIVPTKPNVYDPTTIPVTPETLRIMSSHFKRLDQSVANLRSVMGETVMSKSNSTLTWYSFGSVNEHIAQWMEGKEKWDERKRPVLELLREEAKESKRYAQDILRDFPEELAEDSSVYEAKGRMQAQVTQYDRLLRQAEEETDPTILAPNQEKKGFFQRLFGSASDSKSQAKGSHSALQNPTNAGEKASGAGGELAYYIVTPFSSYNGVQSLRSRGADGKNRAYLLGLNHGPGY